MKIQNLLNTLKTLNPNSELKINKKITQALLDENHEEIERIITSSNYDTFLIPCDEDELVMAAFEFEDESGKNILMV